MQIFIIHFCIASYTPSSRELANEEHSIHDEACDTQKQAYRSMQEWRKLCIAE